MYPVGGSVISASAVPAPCDETLIPTSDNSLACAVVAVVPVDAKCSLKLLATVWGGKRAVMAHRSAAERLTGYVVGGISPLGQKRRLPSVLDESALTFDRVYVSAGRRGLELGLAPGDLVSLSGAVTASITA